MSDEIARRRAVAEAAARAAGAVHRRYFGQRLERDVKGGDRSDYATLVDHEAQAAVQAVIDGAFPGEVVVGEEDGRSVEELERLVASGCWVVDPLDGTLEFAHANPTFSAIVSYVKNGRPLACAVYFPLREELFSAGDGLGATLNGAPIRVSGERELKNALLVTVFRSTLPAEADRFTADLRRVLPRVEAFRLPGPPAPAACYLASGGYDVFVGLGRSPGVAPRPQPWEWAAFILLVREAGGAVASLDGGPPGVLTNNVYAASEELLRSVVALLNE